MATNALRSLIDELNLPDNKCTIRYYDREIVSINHNIFCKLTIRFDSNKNATMVDNDYFGILGRLFFNEKSVQKRNIKMKFFELKKYIYRRFI